MDPMDDPVVARVWADHVDELVRFATGLVGPDVAADVTTDAFVALVGSRVWPQARNHRVLWF